MAAARVRLEDWFSRRVGALEEVACRLTGGVPGGLSRRSWQGLVGRRRAGDALWHFRVPGAQWRDGVAQRGVALLRGGRVVACLITRDR